MDIEQSVLVSSHPDLIVARVDKNRHTRFQKGGLRCDRSYMRLLLFTLNSFRLFFQSQRRKKGKSGHQS